MAKKRKPPARVNKPISFPSDYLRGSKVLGEKYTAWDTYGQGKPDFGKGAGPGEPYHEVQKTNLKDQKPTGTLPGWGKVRPRSPNDRNLPPWGSPRGKSNSPGDARTAAIRRRLGWM